MRRVLLVALLLAGRAAEAAPAVPGTRVASHDDLLQRRAIRGQTLFARESDELRAVRRFEEEQLYPALGRRAPLEVDLVPPPAYAPLALPDLPVRWDPRTVRFVDYYVTDRRGRAVMTAWLKAQGRYRELIEEALRRHHLPHALLYVAMIESGYDPLDRSFAGASGLWQFMPEAARIYGLRVDHWVDERNDPEKATEAQMRYLDDLQARFGSWHLALAAFNAGYGAALAAAAKYNTNDYWELCRHEDGLPWETVLYVPKILAAAVVGDNRATLGFGEITPEPPFAYDAVTVQASVTLDEAARAAGVPADKLAPLNPELRQGRTPPGEPWTLKLPVGSGARFLARVNALTAEREPLATYTVQQGDRVETLARRHQVSPARLRRDNGLRDAGELRPGMVVLVPRGAVPPLRKPGKAERPAPEGEGGDAPTIVPVPDRDAAVDGRKRLLYRVAPGDGVADVARHFQVAEDDLVRWNRLDPRARLCAGLILQVWVEPALDVAPDQVAILDPERLPGLRVVGTGSEEHLDFVEARRGRKRVTVAVRAGDTLKRVGLRHGLTEGDMERINRRPRSAALRPGELLTVYVPMAAEERAAVERRYRRHEGPRPLVDPGKAPLDDGPVAPAPVPAEDPAFALERAVVPAGPAVVVPALPRRAAPPLVRPLPPAGPPAEETAANTPEVIPGPRPLPRLPRLP